MRYCVKKKILFQYLWSLECISRARCNKFLNHHPMAEERKELLASEIAKNGRDEANIVSKKAFWYLNGFFATGWDEGIKAQDISGPQKKAESEKLTQNLEYYWNQEIKKEKPSLFRALFKAFITEVLKKSTGTWIAETARFMQCFFLSWLLEAFKNGDMTQVYIWAAAFGNSFNIILYESKTHLKFNFKIYG